MSLIINLLLIDRHKQKVLFKNVHMPCPRLHSLVPSLSLTSDWERKQTKVYKINLRKHSHKLLGRDPEQWLPVILRVQHRRRSLFCCGYLRVLDVAFAGVVPPRQLLEEETAEDVAALGHSCSSFVEEVSGLQWHINIAQHWLSSLYTPLKSWRWGY